MFSFRFISLFSALACATLSSAIPVQNSILGDLTGSLDNTPSTTNLGSTPIGRSPNSLESEITQLVDGTYLPTGAKRQYQGRTLATGEYNLRSARGGPIKSCPEIYDGATTALQPIVADLKAVLSLDVVDKVVVIAHLNAIIAIIKAAIADLKLLVTVDAALALTFKGVICTVHEVALLIYALLDLLLGVLYLVAKAVTVVDVTVSSLVVSIGALLVELLTLTLSIVVDLRAELGVVIQPLIAIIDQCNYTPILALLGIKA